jgi:hypothetical protein
MHSARPPARSFSSTARCRSMRIWAGLTRGKACCPPPAPTGISSERPQAPLCPACSALSRRRPPLSPQRKAPRSPHRTDPSSEINFERLQSARVRARRRAGAPAGTLSGRLAGRRPRAACRRGLCPRAAPRGLTRRQLPRASRESFDMHRLIYTVVTYIIYNIYDIQEEPRAGLSSARAAPRGAAPTAARAGRPLPAPTVAPRCGRVGGGSTLDASLPTTAGQSRAGNGRVAAEKRMGPCSAHRAARAETGRRCPRC